MLPRSKVSPIWYVKNRIRKFCKNLYLISGRVMELHWSIPQNFRQEVSRVWYQQWKRFRRIFAISDVAILNFEPAILDEDVIQSSNSRGFGKRRIVPSWSFEIKYVLDQFWSLMGARGFGVKIETRLVTSDAHAFGVHLCQVYNRKIKLARGFGARIKLLTIE